MKFVRFKPSKKPISHTADAKQIPMFFLTDVSGMGAKVHTLVDAINNKRDGQTPLFVYDEPYNQKFNAFNRNTHASTIANEVVRKLNGVSQPIILVGFSDGGRQAVEASHILKRMGYAPIVWNIDEPSPESVSAFCERDDENYKNLLIAMVREASSDAFKNKHNDNFISLNDAFLSACAGLDVEGRIDWLADQIRTKLKLKATDTSKEMQAFNHTIAIMKRNAVNANFEDLERTENDKIDHLFLLLTNKTRDTYSTNAQGGWGEHSHSVVDLLSVNDKAAHLANKPHNELMKPENADLIADLILESQKQLKELEPIELAAQQEPALRKQQEAILKSLRAQRERTADGTPDAAKLERKIRKLTAVMQLLNDDEDEESTSDEEINYSTSPTEEDKKADVTLFGIFNKTAPKRASKTVSIPNNVQHVSDNVQRIETDVNNLRPAPTSNL